MIKIKIYKQNNNIIYFEIKGHANAGEYGEDIVCASVSSVVQMALNGILEVLNLKNIKYEQKHGLIICDLQNSNLLEEDFEKTNILTKSMSSYLEAVANEYPKYVKMIMEEV